MNHDYNCAKKQFVNLFGRLTGDGSNRGIFKEVHNFSKRNNQGVRVRAWIFELVVYLNTKQTIADHMIGRDSMNPLLTAYGKVPPNNLI